MINILETPLTKPKAKKIVPHYSLVFQYIIGSTCGFKSTKVKVKLDDPIIERFFKTLKGLMSNKDMYYIFLEEDCFDSSLANGLLNQEDYDFLKDTLFNKKSIYSKLVVTYVERFSPFNSGDTTLQDIELFYFDEDGVKFEAKVK